MQITWIIFILPFFYIYTIRDIINIKKSLFLLLFNPAEEIGDKHIDDGRENIDVKGFDSRKERDLESHRAEILKVIDDLEANIKQ